MVPLLFSWKGQGSRPPGSYVAGGLIHTAMCLCGGGSLEGRHERKLLQKSAMLQVSWAKCFPWPSIFLLTVVGQMVKMTLFEMESVSAHLWMHTI